MFVVRPGSVSSRRNLDDLLKETYEEIRASNNKELADRTKAGNPTDDSDWVANSAGPLAALHAAVVGATDRGFLRSTAQALVDATSGGLEEMPPYQRNEDLASVSVRLRTVSRERYLEVVQRMASGKGLAGEEARAFMLEQTDLMLGFIAEVVAEVSGLEEEDEKGNAKALVLTADPTTKALAPDDMETIRNSGLTQALFSAARDFQRLTGSKKKLCGRPPPSTSADVSADRASSG